MYDDFLSETKIIIHSQMSMMIWVYFEGAFSSIKGHMGRSWGLRVGSWSWGSLFTTEQREWTWVSATKEHYFIFVVSNHFTRRWMNFNVYVLEGW